MLERYPKDEESKPLGQRSCGCLSIAFRNFRFAKFDFDNPMSLFKRLNPSKHSLTLDEAGTLFLLTAFIFGIWFRFMPVWIAGFPLNDGGMFYSMMNDLQANRFIPPAYTTYNHLNIPFAYPPLAFYIGAGLSSLLGVSGIEILRWLPAAVNGMSVPVFYLLAKEITRDKLNGAVATLVFAFIPHLTPWLSSGGGMTRSFGLVFAMLTTLYAIKIFRTSDKKFIWVTALFGSLAMLSHPEAGLYTASFATLAWLLNSPSWKNTINALLVALGVAFLAGSWYVWVIYQHWIEPILSALNTGGHSLLSVLKILNINYLTGESYLSLFSATGILGLVFLIISREYLAPLMLLAIFVVEPRSAHILGNIPLAIGSGAFVVDVLLPAIQREDEGQNIKRGATLLLLLIMPYIFVNATLSALSFAQDHVSERERDAMKWARESTPVGSRFAVLTSENEAWCDSSGEWFPAIAERYSIATLQGREWLIGTSYNEFATHRSRLHACLESDVSCLEHELEYFGGNVDYVYVALQTPTRSCNTVSPSQRIPLLVLSLEESPNYSSVYDSPEVVIFERK